MFNFWPVPMLTIHQGSCVPDWGVDHLERAGEDAAAGRRRVGEVEALVGDGVVRLEHHVRRPHRASHNLSKRVEVA